MAERDAKGWFIVGKPLSPRLQNVYDRMIAIGLLDECAFVDPSAQLDCALIADHKTDNESHSVTLRN